MRPQTSEQRADQLRHRRALRRLALLVALTALAVWAATQAVPGCWQSSWWCS